MPRKERLECKKVENIIWSDESRFTIFKNDGPGRVWRTSGTRFNIENLRPTVKHGSGGVMMWDCFSGKGIGPLVKIDGKMNRHDYIKVLETNLLPLIDHDFNGRGYSFQDRDGAVPQKTGSNSVFKPVFGSGSVRF